MLGAVLYLVVGLIAGRRAGRRRGCGGAAGADLRHLCRVQRDRRLPGRADRVGRGGPGAFPLLFVLFFLSSINLPRPLIEIDWFRTIATWNPISTSSRACARWS
jgi:hypothetical protein